MHRQIYNLTIEINVELGVFFQGEKKGKEKGESSHVSSKLKLEHFQPEF